MDDRGDQARAGREDVLDPNPDDIDSGDVAHHLSRQVRFGGALEDYTVAQHCVAVTVCVAQNWKGGPGIRDAMKLALLHDAAEAYVRDLPTPVKRNLPGYRAIEDSCWCLPS